ncbi:hypothetical protein WME91_02480 [Sorangium sp. So ce269]
MIKDFLTSGLLALAVVGASGCVVDASEEEEASEGIGVAEQPLTALGTYHWEAGLAPTAMGSASDRTCYLSMLQGDFESGDEWVHAYISNGTWYLGGKNTHGSVRAGATCVSTIAGRTSEFSWSQGGSNVDLGSDVDSAGAPRACFLTRFGGNFDSLSESVSISSSGGKWWLGGSSSRTGVHARARCITVATKVFHWMLAHQFGDPGDDPVYVETSDFFDTDTQCMLTGVAGELTSNNQLNHTINIWRGEWPSPLVFSVWTTRSQLRAWALCVR